MLLDFYIRSFTTMVQRFFLILKPKPGNIKPAVIKPADANTRQQKTRNV